MRFVITILFAFVALGLTANTGSAQTGSASVSGRMYYQADPSGAVPGGVALVPADIEQPIPIEDFRDDYLIDVYPDGNFEFSNLPPGEYLLGALGVNSDYVPALNEQFLIQDGTHTQLLPALRLELAAGEQLQVDVAIIQEVPDATKEPVPPPPDHAGSISGRITIDGLRPSGPLNIYWVPAHAEQPIVFHLYSDNIVTANDRGEYTVRGLSDGDYFLVPPLGSSVASVSSRATLRDADFRLFVGGVGTVIGQDHADRLDIPAEGLVLPLGVIEVSVEQGMAVTGVDFELRYTQPSPAPLSLPSAGEGSVEGGVRAATEPILVPALVLLIGVGASVIISAHRRTL